MRKGLPIVILVGVALVGMASAASAQQYRHRSDGTYNSDSTSTRQNRARAQYRSGTEGPPAAGEGRVNSDDQY